jgi:GTPase SAR1 family protein
MQIDISLEKFKEFKLNISEYIKSDMSETDTRSKVIDNLLKNVLGWDENDIKREEYVGTGFYDYKITIPEFSFIIEAKKNFVDLVIPNSNSKVSINILQKGNSEIIEQIRKYSFNSGCQFGVITNGRQYIFIKLFNTDGTNWNNNLCLIYNDLDKIEENFIEFYNNFSKECIAENRGFLYDLPESNVKFETILTGDPSKDTELVRNEFHGYLSPIFDDIFGELFSEDKYDDVAFIKKCFVENDDTKRTQNEIERLFNDKAPKLAGVLPIVNFNTLKKSIAEDISRDIIKTNSNAPKPIIIIGSKGAGKTTFINHLFKYKFKTSEIPNHYIVYIDFRSFFESESIFEPSRLAKEILNNIQLTYGELKLHTIDILKRVYIHEIKKKNEGTWNNVKEHDPNEYQKKLSDFLDESQSNYLYHLEMVAAYLIWERQKRLIIIIDNADQFEQEIQKKIFLFSSTLNKKMQCGTVISLREGYYYQWRLTPPFDAFISNVYHITAPKYSEVLEKRIDYAIENLTLENENKIHSTHIVDSEDVITQMIDFLSAIKKSLFTESNTEILDYLFYTTYPNIREGLKIFKIFLTSMHTKIQVYVRNERIKAEVKNNSSVIPFHEFLKSIGLQNTHYYSSGRSIIHNILTPPPGSTDHLINVYLLKFLDKVDSSNSSDKFTSLSQIYNLFSSFGYRPDVLKNALNGLLNLNLINTDDQFNDTERKYISQEANLQITAKGYYYYRTLIKEFQYIDLILQDTPIFSDLFLKELRKDFPKSDERGKRNLHARIKTAKKFIEYLEEQSKKTPQSLIRFFGNINSEIQQEVLKDIENIERESGAPKSKNL